MPRSPHSQRRGWLKNGNPPGREQRHGRCVGNLESQSASPVLRYGSMEVLGKGASMRAKVLKTESDYKNALEELGRLMDLHSAAGTRESEQLELLALLIRDHETKHHAITPPEPLEAIQFRMEHKD